jgi:Flp pilus assembly protein TadG
MTPFLLTLIFGGLDFGALFNTSQVIAASARNGAEYARNSPTCQAVSSLPQSPAAAIVAV